MLNRKPGAGDIIINSKKHEPAIREFGRAYSSGMIVNASEIRSKIFSYLGRRPKYDLILTGDRGGTLLFTDRQLLRFGKKSRGY